MYAVGRGRFSEPGAGWWWRTCETQEISPSRFRDAHAGLKSSLLLLDVTIVIDDDSSGSRVDQYRYG